LGRKLIAGNWKMNGTLEETARLLEGIARSAAEIGRRADLLVIPPFTALVDAARFIALSGAPIALGGQDLYWEENGAFTGEVSGKMLLDAGCSHVLVGHSERRALFGERGDVLLKKTEAALREGLIPILCIGEDLVEREEDRTEQVLDAQLAETLFRLPVEDQVKVVLAYEPVWAIGTGRNATDRQVEDTHRHIRARFSAEIGEAAAARVRILYGGSVNRKNAADLLACPGVDGALVGGASLRAEEFLGIAGAAPAGA